MLVGVVRAGRVAGCAREHDPLAVVPVADVEDIAGDGAVDGGGAGLGPASGGPDGFVVPANTGAGRAQSGWCASQQPSERMGQGGLVSVVPGDRGASGRDLAERLGEQVRPGPAAGQSSGRRS